MSTVLFNDYASRQLISDISPIEGVDTPYTITSGNFWGETATVDNPVLIYRSAFGKYYESSVNDYGIVVAFFDSEPALSGRYGNSATKVNYSGNLWYVYFSRTNRGSEATSDLITFNTLESWKEYIFSPMQPLYNWQSVPSISGKNGISQPLSSHLDINDGEPITTSDTTKYSLNSNSNINKLVQDKLNS